ncbi:MAG: alginate export family protein [Gemmatimonadetes bacterium]|nr:alginate export family protein [Gemmatimonadota bacterium]
MRPLSRSKYARLFLFALAGYLPALCTAPAAHADDTGKVMVDVRYRAEYVDQENLDATAAASTIRLRLGYQTPSYRNAYVFAEMEDIRALGNDEYNSTANGRGALPVVVDPEDTELNQAFVAWANGGSSFKIGKQRFTLDNHRFFGNVGWRQNEQTLDGLAVNLALPAGVGGKLTYAHWIRANRIFGAHHPSEASARAELFADVLHYARPVGGGAIAVYAHLIDLVDAGAASHANFGLRGSYDHAVSHGKVAVTAEIAQQNEYRLASEVSRSYYAMLDLGATLHGVGVHAATEVLSGNGEYAFQTPFATLHAFNGWSDRFLSTPANGLVDAYGTIAIPIEKAKLVLVYHEFYAEQTSAHYGREWGAALSRAIFGPVSGMLKYSQYEADEFSVDIYKVWGSIGVKFSRDA